ncbi:Probable 3-phenylpropionic acid transporter [hydrothermal vent metagenome]|uniref:Probable 3-phenylpropionic acid transporter n=1 Tax=hydrothermal vent metagenome TaxID=652676 RepID=A0A1W1BRJ4_9ZZZZ
MISNSKKLSLLQLEVPLALFYLFYFALVGVYIIFMPKVLLSFGYDNSDVGIIYAAAPFMRFLIPFVFRRYITLDHRVFLISLASTFIASVVFVSTVDSFWLYLVANLLFGASMGIVLPYVETISLQKLSKSRYGKVRLYGSIGFMVIALWLGKILSYPYEALYYLGSMAFLTLLAGTIVAYYDRDTKLATTEENSNFKLLEYPWFWVSVFLMQVGFGGYYSFFTIYETSHGVSLEIVSWMWSFGVICEIAMLYFQGPLLQRNLLTILKLSLLITVLRWLLLYLYPDSTTMIFASQSLHAVSFALYHTASISYVFTIYTQKKLAQQFFLGIAFGLGGSVGAMLAGQIYGEYMFLIESIITLLSFFALLLHNKNRDEKGRVSHATR